MGRLPQLRLQGRDLVVLQLDEPVQLLDALLGFDEAGRDLFVLETLRIRSLHREGELVAQRRDIRVFFQYGGIRRRSRRHDLEPAARLRSGIGRRWGRRRRGGSGDGGWSSGNGSGRSGRGASRGGTQIFAMLLPRQVLASHLGDRRPVIKPDLVPSRNAQDHTRVQPVDVPEVEPLRIRLDERQHHALDAD